MTKKKYKAITCKDGFSMSVQASQFNYCEPRDDFGPYTAVEVGYPSRTEPALLPWAEDSGRPTETVYGWVPSQTVALVIAKHGGIVSGEVPEGVPELLADY